MKLIFVVLVLLSVVSFASSYSWKLCPGTDTSRIEVTEVNADPTPITKGRVTKFQTKGIAKQNISQAYIRIDVYKQETRIFSTTVGGSYAVNQGSKYEYTLPYTIPSFVPPGDYDGRISYVDNNSQVFTCVSVQLHF